MSIEHMNWATSVDAELSTAEAFILLVLGAAANEEGTCRPVQSEIARKCRMSRESVVRNIGSLRKKGLLELHRGRGNKVIYQLPDLVTQDHKGCDAGSQGQRKGSPPCRFPPHPPPISSPPKELLSSRSKLLSDRARKRARVHPEQALKADEIIDLYPKYRLTRQQREGCRGHIYRLMDKGLTAAQIKGRVQDLADIYDDFKERGDPMLYGPLKFFADIDLVTDPMTWRHLFLRTGDEDEWEDYLYRNSISSDPTPYEESGK